MDKFPLLNTISKLMKWVAYGLVAYGLGYFFLYKWWLHCQAGRDCSNSSNFTYLSLGFGLPILALFLLFFSEIIRVVLAIEKNTRKE